MKLRVQVIYVSDSQMGLYRVFYAKVPAVPRIGDTIISSELGEGHWRVTKVIFDLEDPHAPVKVGVEPVEGKSY